MAEDMEKQLTHVRPEPEGERPTERFVEANQKNDLFNLTLELKMLELLVYYTEDYLNSIRVIVAQIYQKTAVEVSLEKTEDGKKKFSNEDQRQVEIKERLSQNLNYQKMQQDIKTEEFELGLKRIQLRYLNEKLLNLRLTYKEIQNV